MKKIKKIEEAEMYAELNPQETEIINGGSMEVTFTVIVTAIKGIFHAWA